MARSATIFGPARRRSGRSRPAIAGSITGGRRLRPHRGWFTTSARPPSAPGRSTGTNAVSSASGVEEPGRGTAPRRRPAGSGRTCRAAVRQSDFLAKTSVPQDRPAGWLLDPDGQGRVWRGRGGTRTSGRTDGARAAPAAGHARLAARPAWIPSVLRGARSPWSCVSDVRRGQDGRTWSSGCQVREPAANLGHGDLAGCRRKVRFDGSIRAGSSSPWSLVERKALT